MINDLIILEKVYDRIDVLTRSYNIKELSECSFNGKYPIGYFNDIIQKNRDNKSTLKDGYNTIVDLIIASSQIKLWLGFVLMHKEFIKDYVVEKNYDQKFYIAVESRREIEYYMFCELLYQSFYNYWNKIGFIIWNSFNILNKAKIKQNKVVFENSLKLIVEPYDKSPNSLWLKDFYENHYKRLNIDRKEIVHYKSFVFNKSNNSWKPFNKKECAINFQKEKIGLTDYFMNHVEYSIIGFEKTCELLDEIS